MPINGLETDCSIEGDNSASPPIGARDNSESIGLEKNNISATFFWEIQLSDLFRGPLEPQGDIYQVLVIRPQNTYIAYTDPFPGTYASFNQRDSIEFTSGVHDVEQTTPPSGDSFYIASQDSGVIVTGIFAVGPGLWPEVYLDSTIDVLGADQHPPVFQIVSVDGTQTINVTPPNYNSGQATISIDSVALFGRAVPFFPRIVVARLGEAGRGVAFFTPTPPGF